MEVKIGYKVKHSSGWIGEIINIEGDKITVKCSNTKELLFSKNDFIDKQLTLVDINTTKKYKYILILEDSEDPENYDIEVDSEEEIEGVSSCENYSHSEPYSWEGIFNTYEEAKKEASEKKIYKIIIGEYYDGYGGERDYFEEYGDYFVDIWEADDYAMHDLAGDDYDDFAPADFIISQHEKGNKKKGIPIGAFTYKIIGNKKICYYDSAQKGEFYSTHADAEKAADDKSHDYRIDYTDEDNECYYRIEEIPVKDFRIEELDE
ncbi:MAG: hypothetical protein K5765_01090 [Clostridia bacterium]|nr:hypothetical protein [Clostridia bacterium]